MKTCVIAFLALFTFGCGGGAASGAGGSNASRPAAGSASSDATQCLAIANAERQRRPDEPSKVTLRHVLVRYAGAKHAEASFTRTREQACMRAMEARDALRGGAEFPAVVAKYSDERGAATRAGSIGTVERKDLAPHVADAAFELGVGEFSDVVESEYGFHVVMRTE